VGKTRVAADLALKLGTAVISADSRQCYEGMPIGTSWPPSALLAAVRHYFIGTFPVSSPLSAADFEKLSLSYLAEVFRSSDAAVVCGGTGLYIKALCEGLDDIPVASAEVEAQIAQAYAENGIAWLQQAVAQEDPEFYSTGEIQNPARLMRALAVVRTSGAGINTYRTHGVKNRPFNLIKIGLELPREMLYARINDRVDQMMEEGLLKEVERLMPYRELKNLQTVGYSELFEYLDGHCSLALAIDKIKQHTRNYAKRQMTWFRKDPEIKWFRADDPELIYKIMQL